MSGHALAWTVVVFAGLGVAALGFLAAGAWRRTRLLRWPLAAVLFANAVMPHRFDGEHAAPALAVALFRWAFEDYADPLPAASQAAAATLGALAIVLAAAAGRGLLRWRRKAPSARLARRSRRKRGANAPNVGAAHDGANKVQ